MNVPLLKINNSKSIILLLSLQVVSKINKPLPYHTILPIKMEANVDEDFEIENDMENFEDFKDEDLDDDINISKSNYQLVNSSKFHH